MTGLPEVADDDQNSPLHRVVAIGRTINVAGVTLDVIGLELHELSGRLTVVIHDPIAAEEVRAFQTRMRPMREPAPEDWPMHLRPIVRLSDDVGTTYVPWESGGGGSGGVMRHDIGFAPPTPMSASTFTITIKSLTTEPEFPMPAETREQRTIEGPWQIEVPLGPRA